MIKSSLFNKFYEGNHAGRPGIRNAENAGIKAADSSKPYTRPAPKDSTNKAIKQEKETPNTPKEKFKTKPDIPDYTKEEDIAARNLYVPERESLDSLLNEIDTIPLQVNANSISILLSALKTSIFDSKTDMFSIIEQGKAPALAEIAAILGASRPAEGSKLSKVTPKYAFPPTHMRENRDLAEYAYPAIVGLIFPFIEPNILGDLLNKSSVRHSLAKYSEAYSGSLVKQINWLEDETLPNFAKFEHFSDARVGKICLQVMAQGMEGKSADSSAASKFVTGANQATKGIKLGSSKATATNKHTNAIVKNVYYALLTRAIPDNVGLFEIDDRALENRMNNPTAQKTNSKALLTNRANTLVRNRIVSIEKDPFLHRGLFGKNIKNQLAFDYFKRIQKVRKELDGNKFTDTITTIFDDLFHIVPGMDIILTRIDSVLSEFLAPELNSPSVTSPAPVTEAVKTHEPSLPPATKDVAALKAKLDTILDEGTNLLIKGFIGKEAEVFKALSGKNPNIAREYEQQQRSGTATEYISKIYEAYVKPYQNELLLRFEALKNTSIEDFEVISSLNAVIASFSVDYKNKAKRTEFRNGLAYFNAYNTTQIEAVNEGYKYLKSISQIQNKIDSARKLLHKKVGEKGPDGNPIYDTEEPKKVLSKRNLSQEAQKAIHANRTRILRIQKLLDNADVFADKLLIHIKNSITDISTSNDSLMRLLVTGPSTPEETEEVTKVLDAIVQSAFASFFQDRSDNPNDSLAINFRLLTPESFDDSIIEKSAVRDLTAKTEAGALALNGKLQAIIEDLPSITKDIQDFVNLAAAIDTYQGIVKDSQGEPILSYTLDNTAIADGFFDAYFFTNPVPEISADPVILMAVQKVILQRLQEPLTSILEPLQISDFLLPTIVSEQPELSYQIERYIKSLKQTASSGITEAISELDVNILNQKAGQYIYFEAAENIAPVSYKLPTEVSEDYNAIIKMIAINAIKRWNDYFKGSNATKTFLKALLADNSYLIAEKFQSALAIISTDVNIKVARTSFYGDDTQLKTVEDLVRKYQQENNIDGLNEIAATKANADSVLKIKATTPEKTTNNLRGNRSTAESIIKNIHETNPIIQSIMRKFTDIVSYDSWASMYAAYHADVEKQKAEGSYFEVSSTTIMEKLGIAYTGVGLRGDLAKKDAVLDKLNQLRWELSKRAGETSKTKKILDGKFTDIINSINAAKSESDINNLYNNFIKQVGASDITESVDVPTQPQETSLLEPSNNGLKITPGAMLTLKKDLHSRISGFTPKSLVKNQRHGQNVEQVKSYSQMINTVLGVSSSSEAGELHNAINLVGEFFAATGAKDKALSLGKSGEMLVHNFSVIKEFCDIISNPALVGDTNKDSEGKEVLPGLEVATIYNVELQNKLFTALSKLVSLAEVDDTFRTMFLKPPTADKITEYLLGQINPSTEEDSPEVAEFKKKQLKRSGSEEAVPASNRPENPVLNALYNLFQSGMGMTQIKQEVIAVLLEMERVSQNNPEAMAHFDAYPDNYFLDVKLELLQKRESEQKELEQKEELLRRGQQNAIDKRESDHGEALAINKEMTNRETVPPVSTEEPHNSENALASTINQLTHGFNPQTAIQLLATAQDPNTLATLDTAKASMLKAAATSFIQGIPQNVLQQLNNEIQKNIAAGQVKNIITNTPITNQIVVSEQYDSKMELAKALFNNVDLLENRNISLKKSPITVLAVLLKQKGIKAVALNPGKQIKATDTLEPAGTLINTKTNKPYNFEDIGITNNAYWLVLNTNKEIVNTMTSVNKLLRLPDSFEFEVPAGENGSYLYSRVFDFDKTLNIVSSYFKPFGK